jgi:hypothetical protein
MKAAVGLIGVLILVCICISACIFFGTLWQKTSSVPGGSSVSESAAKQGAKHMMGSTMSPSPSPAASQSPAAAGY